ncbi:MAG: PhoPQ-activated protein PqaA family protein, partial [Verrucomicrobiota bacterium]
MIARLMKKFEIHLRQPLLFLVVAFVFVGCSRTGKDGATKSNAAAEPQKVQDERTALDEYVAAPDTNYSFRVVATIPGKDHTTFIVDMTSQAWLTTNEVDRPLWKHWMVIVKPNTVASSKSLLFIGGGGNGGKPPTGADGNLVKIALATKSVVSELKMVPNQPLIFAGETEG